jgi:Txe/YoeB family toxin of toxin-antitoxin system
VSLWRVQIKNSAKGDLRRLKASRLQARFLAIVDTLKADPFRPTDKFEKLRPHSQGFYSRRLNHQHRVVYRVDTEARIVTIYSAWTHYERP